MEVGPVATDFEQEEISTTIAKCQRYYYKLASGGNGFISMGAYYTASNVRSGLHFPVTMRAGPTLDMTSVTSGYRFLRNGASDYFTNLSIDHSQATGCVLFNNSEASGTAGQAGDLATASSNAYIAFDAEL